MDDDFDFATAVVSSIQRGALAEDMRGTSKTSVADLRPLVEALKRVGLQFGEEPIESLDELAMLTELAAKNFAVGRRRAGGVRRTASDAYLEARIRDADLD